MVIICGRLFLLKKKKKKKKTFIVPYYNLLVKYNSHILFQLIVFNM